MKRKNTMRKILFSLLIFVFTSLVLSGCQSNIDNSNLPDEKQIIEDLNNSDFVNISSKEKNTSTEVPVTKLKINKTDADDDKCIYECMITQKNELLSRVSTVEIEYKNDNGWEFDDYDIISEETETLKTMDETSEPPTKFIIGTNAEYPPLNT